MILDAETTEIIWRMAQQNVPFAIAALPGDVNYHLYSNNGTLSGKFVIREFNGKKGIELNETLSFDCVIDDVIPTSTVSSVIKSTDKKSYINGAKAIINDLHSGGKTVYSKVIVAERNCNPIAVALQYHNVHPHTFRYICFTREYGLWFGCTPELVIDASDDKIRTMALAGTRRNRCGNSDGNWDNKNVNEHAFVVEHICNVFQRHGLKVRIGEAENLRFGQIEHLMHIIEGERGEREEREERGVEFSYKELLDELTPTPAICGAPKEQALRHIAKYEGHKRFLYGGEIGIENENKRIYFANLRCACYLGDGKYALYVGGGLTAESDAETEWEETESKAASLLKILKETK